MTEEQPSNDSVTPNVTHEVTDMNEFVRLLVGWHTYQVSVVQQLLQVPKGATFQIDDDTEIVLTAESLSAFKLGIELVMMQLGTLPFVAEVESEEDDTETADAQD